MEAQVALTTSLLPIVEEPDSNTPEVDETQQTDQTKEDNSVADNESLSSDDSDNGDDNEVVRNDFEAVFGEYSSDNESSEDDSAEDPESDFEQQAKKELEKIVAKKKRQTKRKEEQPKKRRKLTENKEKVDRLTKQRLLEEKKKEERMQIVTSLLDKMHEAHEIDLVNTQLHRPATKKLGMLAEIERRVMNSTLQEYFIQKNLLDELGKWMKPSPDKSLPNLQIRKVVLKVLYSLNTKYISLQSLKDSGVGKFVHLYSIHPKETRENRELAERVLNKWLDLDRFPRS